MAKANKDGWIRHRGGKCPVEKGTLIDVRYRDGEIRVECEALDDDCSDWSHTCSLGDILAYRICQPEQQKEAEVKEAAETLRARYLATFEEKKALEVTITARQNDIAMIEKEQEELREKVRALGFDFYDAPNVDEDMNDPKNWKAGDLVELTGSTNEGWKRLKGKICTAKIDKEGLMFIECPAEGPWYVDTNCTFKFHSRPK